MNETEIYHVGFSTSLSKAFDLWKRRVDDDKNENVGATLTATHIGFMEAFSTDIAWAGDTVIIVGFHKEQKEVHFVSLLLSLMKMFA